MGKRSAVWVMMLAGVVLPARAAIVTYNISANGAKEVTAGGAPNQGDPDATAIGTIELNNGTGSGTTGSAVFNLTLTNLNLANLTAHHIHSGAANTTGSPVIDFGNPNTLLSGNTLSGTVSNLSATTITSIFANPAGFYYNLHNGDFPGGAVRDQVPEPGSAAILMVGAVALLARRRRIS